MDTITANMTPEELAKLPPLPGVTERVEAAQARRDVLAQLTLALALALALTLTRRGGTCKRSGRSRRS